MGYYKTGIKHLRDLPPIVEELPEPELSGFGPIPAAVCFTADGLELRPLQGCSAGDVATLSRILLTPWFLCEPRLLKNLIEGADDGLTVKQ